MSDTKKLETYIRGIHKNARFGVDNIVVEHRSNNPKRDYLFVNKSQCKHIPCKPSQMIDMCQQLATVINEKVKGYQSVLIVGFAETATAIASITATFVDKCTYVIKTTRENIEDTREVVNFEEEHSHSTTHRILTYNDELGLDFCIYDYVLFIDDELSTGNTILNLVRKLQQKGVRKKYGVASICNWQSAKNKEEFVRKGIDIMCLISGNIIDEHAHMNIEKNIEAVVCGKREKKVKRLYTSADIGQRYRFERLGHNKMFCSSSFSSIIGQLTFAKSVRVVGTEEFMATPILIANAIEKLGIPTICHSTTLSSIDVIVDSDDYSNEICSKHIIPSVYDNNKYVNIYNTEGYVDLVLLVTDVRVPDDILSEYTRHFNCKSFCVVEL